MPEEVSTTDGKNFDVNNQTWEERQKAERERLVPQLGGELDAAFQKHTDHIKRLENGTEELTLYLSPDFEGAFSSTLTFTRKVDASGKTENATLYHTYNPSDSNPRGDPRSSSLAGGQSAIIWRGGEEPKILRAKRDPNGYVVEDISPTRFPQTDSDIVSSCITWINNLQKGVVERPIEPPVSPSVRRDSVVRGALQKVRAGLNKLVGK